LHGTGNCCIFDHRMFSLKYYIVGFLAFSISCAAMAQGNFYNRGALNIGSGSEVEVKGNIVLNRPVTGSGIFELTGSATQEIKGTQPVVESFRMNNTGNAVLRNNFSVRRSADFQSGQLSLGPHFLLLDTGFVFSGGNASAYIVTESTGKIVLPVSSSGISVPSGSASGFHPFVITELGTPDTFLIRSFAYLPANGQYIGSPVGDDVALLSWEISDLHPGGNDLLLGFGWQDIANASTFDERFAVPVRFYNGSYQALDSCGTDVRFTDPNLVNTVSSDTTGIFGIGDDLYLPYVPEYSVTPAADTAFCAGGSALYTAGSGLVHHWSNGDTAQSVLVTQSGAYNVGIENAQGCIYFSDSVTVTVLPLPVAVLTPSSDTSVCEGDTITLSAGGGIEYTWNTADTTSSIQISAAGMYYVDVLGLNGCTGRSDTVSLYLLPLPPVPSITRLGNDLSASPGTASYQWYRDGLPVTGATGQTYTVTQNGTYTVEITNPSGCASLSAPYVFNDLGIDGGEAWSYTLGPNPSGGTVNLQLSSLPAGNCELVVSDISGRQILRRSVQGNNEQVQLANAGVYLFSFRVNGEVRFISRVVIR